MTKKTVSLFGDKPVNYLMKSITAARKSDSKSVLVPPRGDYRDGEKDVLIVTGKNKDIERLHEK
jgi:Trk K+ transport system NAD-binding subunit